MQMNETSRFVHATSSGQPIFITMTGRPVEINFTSGLPAGATVFLNGTVNGSQVSVQLTVHNGEIEVPRAVVDQFTVEGRYNIRINGVPFGQSIDVNIGGLETFLYDPDSALGTQAASATVAGGQAVLASPHGRVESLDIENVTPTGASANYILFVNPVLGTQSINITGMQNTTVMPSGIMITGLTPDANGVIHVPQAILNQLDGDDASVFLLVTGLVDGTTLGGTLSVRQEIPQAEGIFVQASDATGAATGGPPVRIDGAGKFMPYDDDAPGAAKVVKLAGGGFAVEWFADVTGDDDGDTLAIQRYNAVAPRSARWCCCRICRRR